MRFYPVNLELKGKGCVVVGGGKVAERKVEALLDCGADVTVISPKLTSRLEKLSDDGKIRSLKRVYKAGDLKSAYLAIVSTNDHRVNEEACREAKRRRIMVNVVSSPKLSDFTTPSVIRRGNLMITLSTSGGSPALSKRLRIELEGILGDEYDLFTAILAQVRKKFAHLKPEERRRLYREVAMSQIPDLLRQKRPQDAEKELNRITGLGFNDIEYKSE